MEIKCSDGSSVRVECAHDVLLEIEKVVPNPRNPNKHPKRQIELLTKIIRARGWRHPITVSTRSGFIVAGAGRREAALLLGCQNVPVDYQDFTSDAEEWADLIADNIIAELAETDKKLMGELLSELKTSAVDLELTGYKIQTADELIARMERKSQPADAPTIINAASLEDLKPTQEELDILTGRKFVVEFSGGKDSSAATIWLKTFFPESHVELMFVDLGADFVGFNIFLRKFAEHVGYALKVLRAERTVFDAFLDKGDWPLFVAPYCHEILHAPMDDFIRSHDPGDVCVVRGGRLAEKASRSKGQESRFRTIERVANYRFFEPLYYGDKAVSESVLNESGAPVWEGYQFGNQRTACRICPGQKPSGYAAIRANYPDVWQELLFLEKRFGPGAWQRREDGIAKSFEVLADLGQEGFESGGFLRRNL